MNKLHIFSTLILTAVLSAGCAKEFESRPDESGSAAIELLSVSTDPMTKAVITGTSFTTDEAAEGIGLFLLDGSGKAYGTCPANVKYTFSSDKWTAASPLRVGGNKGYLYGYYPYSSTATIVKAIPVQSSINGTDYLYATPVEVTDANAKSVSLSLNHALARVSLSFRLDESYVGDGVLSEISLSGDSVAASGWLDATDGSIDATASKFTASTEQTLSKSAATTLECLIVPVAVSGSSIPDVKIGCIIDGKYFGATFTGDKAVKIIQGVQTGISFTVKNTSIEVDGSSIIIWGEGDSQTFNVGGNHAVTIAYSSDEGIKDDVWIRKVDVVNNSVVITAQTLSCQYLKCTMADGNLCTSQSKEYGPGIYSMFGDLIGYEYIRYSFIISDITSDITATIGYAQKMNIAVSPVNAGYVRITGDAYEGETVTLNSIPLYEYGFDAWLDKDGKALSYDETYSNARLSSGMKVEFKKNLLLDGVFTVNGNGKKVRFTRGNLYYDNTSCKVEQHQYDYNHKYYQAIHVSHFKWCHDLVNAVKMSYDANSEGQYTFFTEVEGFTVSGFDANQCHTLTIEELQYLFSDGSYNNDIRRGKYRSRVTVCGERNCVVLLPDNWEWGSNQDKQEYSYTEWKHMEDAGAVCLPAAGYRDEGEDEVKSTGLNGYYWTSSSEESPCAFCYVVEGYRGFVGRDYELRNSAYSVRLVTEYQ